MTMYFIAGDAAEYADAEDGDARAQRVHGQLVHRRQRAAQKEGQEAAGRISQGCQAAVTFIIIIFIIILVV